MRDAKAMTNKWAPCQITCGERWSCWSVLESSQKRERLDSGERSREVLEIRTIRAEGLRFREDNQGEGVKKALADIDRRLVELEQQLIARTQPPAASPEPASVAPVGTQATADAIPPAAQIDTKQPEEVVTPPPSRIGPPPPPPITVTITKPVSTPGPSDAPPLPPTLVEVKVL